MTKINKSNVDEWINKRINHQVKALQTASKIFDNTDNLSVNTLEAIYGKESSFGNKEYLDKSRRGSDKPAGHFQQKKSSAIENGLIINSNDDKRFDIDEASISAAKQLKSIDNYFSKKTNLGNEIFTIPISDKYVREVFVIASYNIGQGRIAKAQNLTKTAGKNPKNWFDVKEFLIPAGAKEYQAKEVVDYVSKVLEYNTNSINKSHIYASSFCSKI